jgi:hypothetical protein
VPTKENTLDAGKWLPISLSRSSGCWAETQIGAHSPGAEGIGVVEPEQVPHRRQKAEPFAEMNTPMRRAVGEQAGDAFRSLLLEDALDQRPADQAAHGVRHEVHLRRPGPLDDELHQLAEPFGQALDVVALTLPRFFGGDVVVSVDPQGPFREALGLVLRPEHLHLAAIADSREEVAVAMVLHQPHQRALEYSQLRIGARSGPHPRAAQIETVVRQLDRTLHALWLPA